MILRCHECGTHWDSILSATPSSLIVVPVSHVRVSGSYRDTGGETHAFDATVKTIEPMVGFHANCFREDAVRLYVGRLPFVRAVADSAVHPAYRVTFEVQCGRLRQEGRFAHDPVGDDEED